MYSAITVQKWAFFIRLVVFRTDSVWQLYVWIVLHLSNLIRRFTKDKERNNDYHWFYVINMERV